MVAKNISAETPENAAKEKAKRAKADAKFRNEQDALLDRMMEHVEKADAAPMKHILGAAVTAADFAEQELKHGSPWKVNDKTDKETLGVVDYIDAKLQDSGIKGFNGSRLLGVFGLLQFMGGEKADEDLLLSASGYNTWKQLLPLIRRDADAKDASTGAELPKLEYKAANHRKGKKEQLDPEKVRALIRKACGGKMSRGEVQEAVEELAGPPISRGTGDRKPTLDPEKIGQSVTDFFQKGAGSREEKKEAIKLLLRTIRDLARKYKVIGSERERVGAK